MSPVPTFPMPPLRRAMVFIDGENLVLRYQAMLTEGRIPNDDVRHERDTYVWASGTVVPPYHTIARATYYTYAQGCDEKVLKICDDIRNMFFMQYAPRDQPHVQAGLRNLYPKVFKKNQGTKAKGVDIQMTVDILTHTYQNNLDSVYLLSGDGDYKPVIEECARHGKVVYVGAFSSGLNKGLTLVADHFTCIDDMYFLPKSEKQPQSSQDT